MNITSETSVIFNVCGSYYMISGERVLDLGEVPDITCKMPNTPNYMTLGKSFDRLINMIDLGLFLHSENYGNSKGKQLVVLSKPKGVGFIVNKGDTYVQTQNTLHFLEVNLPIGKFVSGFYKCDSLPGKIISALNVDELVNDAMRQLNN